MNTIVPFKLLAFVGKSALVTFTSWGIGVAIATGFAQAGGDVA